MKQLYLQLLEHEYRVKKKILFEGTKGDQEDLKNLRNRIHQLQNELTN